MQRNFPCLGMVALSALLLSVACKKGDDGPPGTANVKFSEWFTPATYKKDTVFGIWGFSFTKPATAITQTVIDSGVVLVFARMTGYNQAVWPTNQVAQLPITITYMQGGLQNDTWESRIFPGNVYIRFHNDHNIYNSISNAHSYRYIIIPGGAAIAGRGINLSYEEICRKYNIPY